MYHKREPSLHRQHACDSTTASELVEEKQEPSHSRGIGELVLRMGATHAASTPFTVLAPIEHRELRITDVTMVRMYPHRLIDGFELR